MYVMNQTGDIIIFYFKALKLTLFVDWFQSASSNRSVHPAPTYLGIYYLPTYLPSEATISSSESGFSAAGLIRLNYLYGL